MRVTLKTIADAADASISTVSRALSGDPSISTESAARVREFARKLNYRSRNSRKAPSSEQILANRTIAIVSLGMHRSLLSLPAVATAINGAEEELARRGARAMLAHVPDLSNPHPNLTDGNLAGIIVAGSSQGETIGTCRSELVTRLRKIPSVWILGRPTGCWGDAVGSNDYLAGQRAADYLIDRGHRQLAFVNPKPDHLLFIRREDGFMSRARRRGAEVRSFSQAPAGGWPLPDRPALTTDAVETLVTNLLAATPRPTAIFAAADSIAAAIYRALAARNVRVGSEISVISANNDQSLIASLYPHLTTFDIHAEQIGREAVSQLARRLAHPGSTMDVEVLLEPELLERESVHRI